jgi:hypothetical protein
MLLLNATAIFFKRSSDDTERFPETSVCTVPAQTWRILPCLWCAIDPVVRRFLFLHCQYFAAASFHCTYLLYMPINARGLTAPPPAVGPEPIRPTLASAPNVPLLSAASSIRFELKP